MTAEEINQSEDFCIKGMQKVVFGKKMYQMSNGQDIDRKFGLYQRNPGLDSKSSNFERQIAALIASSTKDVSVVDVSKEQISVAIGQASA